MELNEREKDETVLIRGIIDCWFESGSMPYAQVHYPFDNKDWFENNFPADFTLIGFSSLY